MSGIYKGKDGSEMYIRKLLLVVNTLVIFWSIDLVIYDIYSKDFVLRRTSIL